VHDSRNTRSLLDPLPLVTLSPITCAYGCNAEPRSLRALLMCTTPRGLVAYLPDTILQSPLASKLTRVGRKRSFVNDSSRLDSTLSRCDSPLVISPAAYSVVVDLLTSWPLSARTRKPRLSTSRKATFKGMRDVMTKVRFYTDC